MNGTRRRSNLLLAIAGALVATLSLATHASGCDVYESGARADAASAGGDVLTPPEVAKVLPDGESPPPSTVVHVAPFGDDDGADGTRERPFGSVRGALAYCGTSHPEGAEVQVCSGPYREHAMLVRTPITLGGGYNCTTWERAADPAINETVIEAEDASAETLLDIDVPAAVGAVHVEHLTLRGHVASTHLASITVKSRGADVTLSSLAVFSPRSSVGRVVGVLIAGGALLDSNVEARGGSGTVHIASIAVQVSPGAPVRIENGGAAAVSTTGGGVGCVAVRVEPDAQVTLRKVYGVTDQCRGADLSSMALSNHGGSVRSESSGYAAIATDQGRAYGVAVHDVGALESLDDRVVVLGTMAADETAVVGGVTFDGAARASQISNLELFVMASRGNGLVLRSAPAQVDHASVLMVGTTVGAAAQIDSEQPSVRGSLLVCRDCGSPEPRGFASGPYGAIEGNVTRGFASEIVGTDGVASTFGVQTPERGNVSLACASHCDDMFALSTLDPWTRLESGLPLSNSVSCAIAESSVGIAEPSLDAVGIARTAPVSVGARELDTGCIP